MTEPARLHTGARLPSGLGFGLSLAILLATGVCSLLFWQHFQQRAALEASARSLDEIRQARLDLAEGFLYWNLADTPDTPFDRDSALALLRQAIGSFERALAAREGLDTAAVESFRHSVLEFEQRLSAWEHDATPGSQALVQLRILYGNLERQAGRLDTLRQDSLTRLAQQSDRNFALTLSGAALSLMLIIVILAMAIRQQRQMLASRITAEQALRENQQLLQTLFRAIPDLLWLKNPDGVFLGGNPRLEALLGAPEAEIVGKTDYDFVAPAQADGFRANDQAAIAAGGPQVNEETLTFASDGQPRRVQVIKTPIHAADGTLIGVLGIGRDITELKRVEQELQRHRDHLEERVAERTAELMAAREQAEAANQAKGAFLATMSHEIRTPMNAVLGFCHLLGQRPLDAASRELVRKIQVSGDVLLSLIEDVLEFSRLETHRIEITTAPFQLPQLIADIASIAQTEANHKALELVIACPPEVDVLIGDARHLKQVLLKLLANAVKFTERGRVELRVELESEDAREARWRFTVRDSGIGIAPEQQAAIFDAFNQADGSIRRRFGGTGLGLAISQQLVRAMGGRLQVASEPGQGSEFWFVLPLRREPRAQSDGDRLSRPDRAAPRLLGARVLVVDDSEINRDLMQCFLEAAGASVVLADDGQQALDWLDAHPHDVDLVLMDVQMPGLDGYAATRRLRERPHGQALPVIASTAGDLPAFREAARAAGMDDFIAKPFDTEQLLSLIERHIRLPERAAPARAVPASATPASAQPASAILDWAAGLKRWGSPEVYQTYLEKFQVQYAGTGDTLARLCQQGDLASAAALAHKLAGTAGNLALSGLADQARQLEHHLGAGETAAALTLLPELRASLDAAGAEIAGLTPERPQAPPQHPPSDTSGTTRARLHELLDALEQHDLGRAEALLEQLREPLQGALRDIENAITDFDLSGAADLTRLWLQDDPAHRACASQEAGHSIAREQIRPGQP